MNDVSAFTHEMESFYDLVRKDNIRLTREIIDLTLAARDQIKAMFDACYQGGIVDKERGRAIIESFRRSSVSISPTRTGAAASEPASRTAGSGDQDERDGDALKTTEIVREQERYSANPSAASLSSIRVATGKLDILVDLVGELVTIQARLSQTALSKGIPEFLAIAEEVERLTGNLRDETMSMRMIPIGTMFSRFKRLVRDLGQELGKEVELVTEGAETELDKTVIERLGEPLMHLIRNSIDHGIESPDVRARTDKPAAGTVVLTAKHSGAHVLIQIRDDGAGFDLAAIRAKGIERGLVREGESISEKEILSLIFVPGFSTAKTVTSVSGRGVGLDVVKRSIDSLGGTIAIRNDKGAGASMVLKLPLTLAIIEGFLIEVGAERFIFPLSMVEECVELTDAVYGKHLIDVRGQLVPYVRLREQFSLAGPRKSIEQIVIARVEDKRVGFVVDRVIGGYQTVIKNLGAFYRNIDGLSGATILGDGSVALILDVPRLMQRAEQEEAYCITPRGCEK
jgi:two-component system chemotaxis sensor kinase CheA